MIIGVLDDNPAICRLLERALTAAGHEVYSATSPAQFIESIYPDKIGIFECVIVDYHLSEGRSGVEIIRQIRVDYPFLPAILISASQISPSMLQELLDVEILQKPFNFPNLFETLNTLHEGAMCAEKDLSPVPAEILDSGTIDSYRNRVARPSAY